MRNDKLPFVVDRDIIVLEEPDPLIPRAWKKEIPPVS
jgi:hypothetical protein